MDSNVPDTEGKAVLKKARKEKRLKVISGLAKIVFQFVALMLLVQGICKWAGISPSLWIGLIGCLMQARFFMFVVLSMDTPEHENTAEQVQT